jgi:hypothetical protein
LFALRFFQTSGQITSCRAKSCDGFSNQLGARFGGFGPKVSCPGLVAGAFFFKQRRVSPILARMDGMKIGPTFLLAAVGAHLIS